jgi:UDP-glucose 4-epimerase
MAYLRYGAVRALVTGGAGFIGSHLVDALVARGDEVHVLDNLATGSRANLRQGTRLHEGDIRTDAEDAAAEARPEVVFHLAAQADVGTSVERPDFDAEVNVLGTVRVLEAARRHGAQVVFTSTGGAMYGECPRPAREDDEREPLAPYGASKLAGEEYLATWNRLHGSGNVALRLANVYGPRQAAKLEGGVVAIFMTQLARGEGVQIFGDGEQARDFVHVGDVVSALLAAAERANGGGVFNVGTGVATSVNELWARCRDVAGAQVDAAHAPPRPGDVRRSVLDAGRAAAELRWRPERDLDRGLRETWAWASGSGSA